MTKPFDLHQSSYDLLNGARALRQMAFDLAGHGDEDPLRADERDSWTFIVSMMAEKAEACAEAWVDEFEMREKREKRAA